MVVELQNVPMHDVVRIGTAIVWEFSTEPKEIVFGQREERQSKGSGGEYIVVTSCMA